MKNLTESYCGFWPWTCTFHLLPEQDRSRPGEEHGDTEEIMKSDMKKIVVSDME